MTAARERDAVAYPTAMRSSTRASGEIRGRRWPPPAGTRPGRTRPPRRLLPGGPAQLLLDEPTEGIQPSVVLDIERAVRRIIETTGISVLLVEQHLHFVRQADWYYAMQKGGVVASGSTDELSKDVIDRFLSV